MWKKPKIDETSGLSFGEKEKLRIEKLEIEVRVLEEGGKDVTAMKVQLQQLKDINQNYVDAQKIFSSPMMREERGKEGVISTFEQLAMGDELVKMFFDNIKEAMESTAVKLALKVAPKKAEEKLGVTKAVAERLMGLSDKEKQKVFTADALITTLSRDVDNAILQHIQDSGGKLERSNPVLKAQEDYRQVSRSKDTSMEKCQVALKAYSVELESIKPSSTYGNK